MAIGVCMRSTPIMDKGPLRRTSEGKNQFARRPSDDRWERGIKLLLLVNHQILDLPQLERSGFHLDSFRLGTKLRRCEGRENGTKKNKHSTHFNISGK